MIAKTWRSDGMAEPSLRRSWVDPVAVLLVLGASSRMTKLFYKPLAILLAVLARRVAGKVFSRVWELTAHDGASPNATDRDRGWGEIAAAAVIRGAVFSGVRALVSRGGATGFEYVTGRWPGPISTRKPPTDIDPSRR
jgi:hypothetical protein